MTADYQSDTSAKRLLAVFKCSHPDGDCGLYTESFAAKATFAPSDGAGRDLAEISPRSRRDLVEVIELEQMLGCRDVDRTADRANGRQALVMELAEISPRSRRGLTEISQRSRRYHAIIYVPDP